MKYLRSSAVWFVLASVLLAGALFVRVNETEAASSSSGGIGDKIRCAYGQDLNDLKIRAICHFDTGFAGATWITANAGTDQTLPGVAGGSTGWFSAGLPTTSPTAQLAPYCAGSSPTGRGTVYVGPQTQLGYGSIPSGTMIFVSNNTCTLPGSLGTVGTRYRHNWLASCGSKAGTTATVSPGGVAFNQQVGNLSFSSCESTWLGTYTNFATTMHGPADWFPGGAAYDPPSAFCGALVSAVSWISPVAGSVSSVPTASTPILYGYSVTFSTAWTSSQTGWVEVQWPGTTEWYRIFSAGTIANPSVFTTTVRMPAIAGATWGQVKLRCYDSAADKQYLLGLFDNVTSAGDGRQRPCLLPFVYWPLDESISAGQTRSWTITHNGLAPSGYASTITVDFTTYDEAVGVPSATSWPGLTWTNVVTNMALGTSGTYALTAGYTGSVAQYLFRCTDYQGTLYGSGPFSSALRLRPPSGGTAEEKEASCLSSSGIGAWPSSWVPGLVRMGSCVLKSMFIPSSEVTTGFQRDVNAVLASHTPSNYAASYVPLATQVVVGLDDSLVSHRDDSLTLLPASVLPGGSTLPAQTLDSTDLPTDSAMRPVLLVLLWLGFVSFMLNILSVILSNGSMLGIIGAVGRVDPSSDSEYEAYKVAQGKSVMGVK